MDTSERLRAAGLRATAPRTAVLAVLDSAADHEHLSAAAVLERVRGAIGAVSVQAVYDCLDALEQARLVRRIQPAGQPAHFESRVGDNHHHAVCRSCGRTSDIPCLHGSAPCLTPAQTGGFLVDQAEITFWGLCADCADAPS
ncbi:Fur family transcriptional regulator [Herbiconiux sp. L3-i23]|uniref:Fur family transcriptional regulator n=1 Tax=Herbiconiux sp. L3-i23 TaxID=2905871 RepID=UPI00206AF982|nr:Fur family transcriptional regulator [Herbiconiux sp. L3-i23]BDI22679.1 transcriptional repressor [Herbiconiux sp. L3-i23]